LGKIPENLGGGVTHTVLGTVGSSSSHTGW